MINVWKVELIISHSEKITNQTCIRERVIKVEVNSSKSYIRVIIIVIIFIIIVILLFFLSKNYSSTFCLVHFAHIFV